MVCYGPMITRSRLPSRLNIIFWSRTGKEYDQKGKSMPSEKKTKEREGRNQNNGQRIENYMKEHIHNSPTFFYTTSPPKIMRTTMHQRPREQARIAAA